MDEIANSVENSRASWILPVSASTVLLLLIALAVGGLDWRSVTLIIVLVAAGVGLFTWMYRGGGFLALALANFLALYTCLFDFLFEARFASASDALSDLAYAFPVVAFVTGACWFRFRVQQSAEGARDRHVRPSIHCSFWLLPIMALYAGPFFLAGENLNANEADALLAAISGLLGVAVFVASRHVTLFLLRAAVLFESFFRRIASQSQAMFAFLTFYSLILIVFACLYRIIDLYSPGHHFLVAGAMRDITFVESLYFSVISLSTVGYGDITPITNSVRALVAVQTVCGVLLMLFGFAEIMRHATGSREEGS